MYGIRERRRARLQASAASMLAAVLVALLAVSCTESRDEEPGSVDETIADVELGGVARAGGFDGEAEAAAPAASLARHEVSATPDAAPRPESVGRRMIIREVSIHLEVADVFAARDRLAELAAGAGGFLSTVGLDQHSGGRPAGRITLRVPAAGVESVVDAIGDLGEVRSEAQGTHDVTREYLDTEARLRVLRETDARLRGILAARTGNLADVLQVERELSRVVTEIEQLEGQRRYWEEQVSLAAVHVSLAEPPPAVEAGWADPVIQAFRGSLGMLARSAAVLITVLAGALPFVALTLVGWVVFVLVRRGGPFPNT